MAKLFGIFSSINITLTFMHITILIYIHTNIIYIKY